MSFIRMLRRSKNDNHLQNHFENHNGDFVWLLRNSTLGIHRNTSTSTIIPNSNKFTQCETSTIESSRQKKFRLRGENNNKTPLYRDPKQQNRYTIMITICTIHMMLNPFAKSQKLHFANTVWELRIDWYTFFPQSNMSLEWIFSNQEISPMDNYKVLDCIIIN